MLAWGLGRYLVHGGIVASQLQSPARLWQQLSVLTGTKVKLEWQYGRIGATRQIFLSSLPPLLSGTDEEKRR